MEDPISIDELVEAAMGMFRRAPSTPQDRVKHGNELIRERDGSDPRLSLTPDQRHVLWHLARGASVIEAAAQTEVHPERVRRWLNIPRFQRALLVERAMPTSRADLPARPEPKEKR